MTSNRNSSSSATTTTTKLHNRHQHQHHRIDDEIGGGGGGGGVSDDIEHLRVRNASCSASSTLSSTSSSSSSSVLSTSNDHHHHHHNHDHHHAKLLSTSSSRTYHQSATTTNTTTTTTTTSSSDFIDVLVVYPNGFQSIKKLDARKAIYDILIELAATAKLLPSNYALKLFTTTTTTTSTITHHGESNFNESEDDCVDKLIEYTPNQTIGQLNPTKIKITPKTSTLKHFQNCEPLLHHNHHPHFNSSLSSQNNHYPNTHFNNRAQTLAGGGLYQSTSTQPHLNTPFELTNRVEVNLPFNQKTAVRVKLDISLDELLTTICKEAALEKSRYDLVINGLRPDSMLDVLSAYNTKEVTLILKHSETAYVKNSLKSKTSQISSKSRAQNTKVYLHQQQQKQEQQQQYSPQSAESSTTNSSFNRSKSELNLSVSDENSSSNNNSNQKKNSTTAAAHRLTQQVGAATTTTTNSSISPGSMFGFFTRKRRSKSKASLCASHSNLTAATSIDADLSARCMMSLAKDDAMASNDDTSFRKYSTSYVSSSNLTKTKKRLAPPPPPLSTKITPIERYNLLNDNSTSGISVVTIVNSSSSPTAPPVATNKPTRPKSELIDDKMVEKIKQLTKKKQTKTLAPLPPQSLSPCSNSPNSNSSHEINYSSPDHVSSSNNSSSSSSTSGSSSNKNNNSLTTTNVEATVTATAAAAAAKKLFLSMTESSSSSSPITYPSPSLSDASSSASNQERTVAAVAAAATTTTTATAVAAVEKHVSNDEQPKRLHITKINNSLVMPVLKSATNMVNHCEAKEIETSAKQNSVQLSSSNSSEIEFSKSRNDYESVNDCSMSSLNISNNRANQSNYETMMTKQQATPHEDSIVEETSSSNNSSIQALHRHHHQQNQTMDSDEHSPPSKIVDLSLIVSKRSSFGCLRQNNGAVVNGSGGSSKTTTTTSSSEENNSNSSVLLASDEQSPMQQQQPKDGAEEQQHHDDDSIMLNTRIPNVFVSANETEETEIESLRADYEQELVDLVEKAAANNKNKKMTTTPKRGTAVIEVRPEYVRSSLIRISEDGGDMVKSAPTPTTTTVMMSESYLFNGMSLGHNHKSNQSPLQQQQQAASLRSPSSPLPQFPAIGENEINELHGNYVVVRTGDIIEKNGIYYSSDGTIRGYSGTVKKMAGSKTLNEVFLKQQELEQQHEKEYQMDLEKKRQQEQEQQQQHNSEMNVRKDYYKENHHYHQPVVVNHSSPIVVSPSNKPVTTPTTTMNGGTGNNSNNSSSSSSSNAVMKRSSLGNIIANEKRNSVLASSSPISANHTLSSHSNIFKSATTVTPFRKYSTQTIKSSEASNSMDSMDNELSKKLESRRQQIANHVNSSSQNEKLHIDTTNSYSPVVTKSANVVLSSSASSSLPSNHSSSSTNGSSSSVSPLTLNSPLGTPSAAAATTTTTTTTVAKSSFVMSAKFRNSNLARQFEDSGNSSSSSKIESPMAPPPVPPPPPPMPPSMFADPPLPTPPTPPSFKQQQTGAFKSNTMPTPPAVPPKNFKPDTLVCISKKNQLLDARESLLESIKGFNVGNLRKVTNQQSD